MDLEVLVGLVFRVVVGFCVVPVVGVIPVVGVVLDIDVVEGPVDS